MSTVQVWGGQDAPVFWRIPLSGATTMEEIFTHCYNMIVAGTTGASRDGKAVLRQNISEVRTPDVQIPWKPLFPVPWKPLFPDHGHNLPPCVMISTS
jgi:hypothetical protein